MLVPYAKAFKAIKIIASADYFFCIATSCPSFKEGSFSHRVLCRLSYVPLKILNIILKSFKHNAGLGPRQSCSMDLFAHSLPLAEWSGSEIVSLGSWV